MIKNFTPTCFDKPQSRCSTTASFGEFDTTLRYAILAVWIALAFVATSTIAGAQDFIINGNFDDPDATNGSFSDNDFDINGTSVLVTQGSVIDVFGDDNAVQAEGDDIAIEIRGALSSRGGSGTGINLEGNGVMIIGDRASIFIAETGLITTRGTVSAVGTYTLGENATITNAGTIITGNNGFSYGMHAAGGSAIMTNSGSIITGDGSFGHGMHSNDGDNVLMTNTGSIIVGDGSISSGMDATGLNAIMINAGSIITGEGAFDSGMDASNDNANMTNAGSIITTGILASGMNAGGDNATVTNTGSIINADGDSARGMHIRGDDGIVDNSGAIITWGLESYGQFTEGDRNTIINSGRLVSAQDAAIRIGDGTDGNTINVWAPGFIGGAIDFADDPTDSDGPAENTTINVLTGPSHSILWTFEGDTADLVGGAPNFSGPVPWFYNAATQSVATFDPTLLASETDTLGDLTALLSKVGLGAVDGFGVDLPTGDSGALSYLPTGDSRSAARQTAKKAMQGEAVAHRTGRAWATVLGGQMDHDGSGSTLAADITHYGVAAGYSWQHTLEMKLNAMAGYVNGNVTSDARWAASFDHDTHTVFAGLYGERSRQWGDVQFGLTAGHSWIDHNRFVNDNGAPLGESWVSADYNGFFVSPEIAIAKDIMMTNGTTLTPNAGLRYAAQWLGGYSESGAVNAAANATVDARFVGIFEARIGLEATRAFDFGTMTGRIGYLGRWSGGNDDAGITLNGITQDVASGHQALNAVTIGVDHRRDLGEKAFVELDANYLYGDTAAGFDGSLTVGVTF